MKKHLEKLLINILRACSRLPLQLLYLISDLCCPVVYFVVRYRRKVVRKNLVTSFPDASPKRIRQIERRFYRFFCDYAFETLKLLTVSREEIMRRMSFEGIEDLERDLKDHPFVFVYLGHYGNWEWISTLPAWMKNPETHCAQLYRPLNDRLFDSLFNDLRTRFGAENIPKYDAMRRVLNMRRQGERSIIGFISDQAPGEINTHDWTNFLNHDTPVLTGTERIAKKVNAAVYFADVTRPHRGYYRCMMRRMTDRPQDFPDYKLTEAYMKELEDMIRRAPHLWLWSHNRWKHARRK